jgi:hypothetical protein
LTASLRQALVSATSMQWIVQHILEDVDTFTGKRLRDDIAVLAARIF